MPLKRYNEILFAVLGTGLSVAFLVGVVRIWWPHWSWKPAGVAISRPEAARSQAKQALSMCSPLLIADTDYEYIPVSAVRQDNSSGNESMQDAPTGQAGQDDRDAVIDACRFPDRRSNAVINVLVRNSATNEQRLLLDRPGQIISIALPDANCARADTIPCGTVFWLIREEDSNHDGVINEEDAATLYVSDLAAKELHRLSPKGTTVLDWIWNRRAAEVLLIIRRNMNHDGNDLTQVDPELLSAKLWPAAEGTAVLQRSILEQFQRAKQ